MATPTVAASLGGPGGSGDAETECGSAASTDGTPSPQRVDRYRILRKLAEGGFGEVYLAAQDEPVARKVALKIAKAGMRSREVIERFELERRAIAMMDHPSIAKVLDAGTTETGLPYFVMDLVIGLPITEFCDRRRLSIPDRLGLFIKVCQAVQHAHQKGIIHRDIKPSNVMVTTNDAEPQVKVIDFGVAKATQDLEAPAPHCTDLAQIIGTPDYMSPEQAARSPLVDVDTRSDIYSLGILLYRLMVGSEPFTAETLLASGWDEMCRTIREIEPRRPSLRIADLGPEDSRMRAQWRDSEPGEWRRSIRGDLDRIILKAIDKDRERRYETANALALDIERHLNHEPVRAMAPSGFYILRKFLKRNRTTVIVASCVFAILVSAVLAAIDLAVGERRMKSRADRAEEKAVLVLEALDETRSRLDAKLEEVERTRAQLEVEQAEARALNSAFDSASAGHWWWGAGDGWLGWDARMAAVLFGSPVAGTGDLETVLAAIAPADREPLRRLMEEGHAGGATFRAVVRAEGLGADSKPRFLRIFGGPGVDGGLRGICIPVARLDYDASQPWPGPTADVDGGNDESRRR